MPPIPSCLRSPRSSKSSSRSVFQRLGIVCCLFGTTVVWAASGPAPSVPEGESPSDGSTEVLQFKYKWGEPGRGIGQLKAIRGIVAFPRPASDRTLVVVSDAGRDLVRAYTHDFMFVDKWGELGDGPGQFSEPLGVAVDSQGLLLVADSRNHRVQRTQVSTDDLRGVPGEHVATYGGAGEGDGQFDTPTGIVIDSEDNFYVVDTGNHRVQSFDAEGRFLRSWGRRGRADGEFQRPSYVAIDSNDHLYVVDTGNNRVQVFDRDGTYLRRFGRVGAEPGRLSEPKGIAIDTSGAVWIADRRNHRVQKFASDGTFLGAYGSQGRGDSHFSFPEGLAADALGNLYVADAGNHRIQVFATR